MDKDRHIKMPTTFTEQVELLRKRNLEIQNPNLAKETLKRINYYRLSAYMLTLKKDNNFFEGTTFNQLISIYEVDKKLRHLLMEVLRKYRNCV
ncbi:Abi family protein [Oceanobacillus sp. Castelsardo]|uniref:Abi family protein n=1 Tax=Oceanobacillus sp. Castelsardo TaxID=1851204 RepID=UPI0009EE1B47